MTMVARGFDFDMAGGEDFGTQNAGRRTPDAGYRPDPDAIFFKCNAP